MIDYKYIAIHCADTPEGVYFDVDDIREWHYKRNFIDVGYHYVILLDGTIQFGRMLDKKGAHVKGYNSKSIGICYIGGTDTNGKSKDTRTQDQKDSLFFLLVTLKRSFPKAVIQGHNAFPKVTKDCPGFDSKKEYENL